MSEVNICKFKTKLVRKYTYNGLTVEIRYFFPYIDHTGLEKTDGFYTLRLGYINGDYEYKPISMIIRDIDDLNHEFKDFVNFINAFEIWNKEFKKVVS